MDIIQSKEIVKKSISEAIKSSGTQEKLAKKAGLSQGSIGKYFRGETLPTGVTAKKLSAAVNGKQSAADFAPHIFGE